MNNLIEYHFKKALAFLGFGDCEVFWSLSYCQGDGMAFANSRVNGDGLKQIVRKLFYAKDYNYFAKYIDQGLGLTINQSGHYYHCNSMTVDVDWDQMRDFEAELPESIYKTLENRACELRDEVNEYVKSVSKQLEDDGYAIIAGTPCESEPDIVREYKTRGFTVRVQKLHDDAPDVFSDCEDDKWSLIQDIISGRNQFYHLQVVVLDEYDDVIGKATLFNMIGCSQTEDRSIYGERLSLAKEAIAQARISLADGSGEPEAKAA